jgi:biopolymer transport protein ExbD
VSGGGLAGGGGQARGGRATMVLNLTALIDVVFLLIMFFVLVSRFGSYPTLPLRLPSVDDRTGQLRAAGSNPSVDVVPRRDVAQLGGAYRLGTAWFPESPDGLAALTSSLRALREKDPDVEVDVRAERSEPSVRVHPAMQAAADAGVKRVHLMTLPREQGAGGAP